MLQNSDFKPSEFDGVRISRCECIYRDNLEVGGCIAKKGILNENLFVFR